MDNARNIEFSNILEHVPARLHTWVLTLSEEDIAHILTLVGNTINESKKVQHTSSIIGLTGENEVLEILKSKYAVINTAKSGKCGDFIISMNGFHVLVEVKKYSKTVPGLEIEKFYRDIDSNSSICGAIMISLTSRIVGINGNMKYSHQYINGEKIPVIFISLKGIDLGVAKGCVCSAIDILFTEADSKNQCVDINNNISNIVRDIDKNLDYLSQCRLIIHETQAMFNKQLGKVMQQVLSAEININNSVKLLKASVTTTQVDEKSTLSAINNIIASFDLDPAEYNLVIKVMEKMGETVFVTKNRIKNKKKSAAIIFSKSSIQVSINYSMTETLCLNDAWTYNGKVLTVKLTEKTLQTILSLIE